MRDLFGDLDEVNEADPVGVIEDAGPRGIPQSELRARMNWPVGTCVTKLCALVQSGRIAFHMHGNENLFYAPEHASGILQARSN